MTHYFEPPFKRRPLQPKDKKPRQRRRKASDDEDSLSDDPESPPEEPEKPPAGPGINALTKAEHEQYRTAGVDPDELIPSGPYPHRAVDPRPRIQKPKELHHELSSLHPPLHPGQGAERSRPLSLADGHATVLTTILHRCLLEGDHVRAGRAWTLMLRTSCTGGRLDLRAHGRWGIGAEVLLRQGTRVISSVDESSDESDDDGNAKAPEPEQPFFSEQGFKAAREYYELLCLQYPSRKTNRLGANASDFYPAMFGLWIAEVSERSKRARKGLDLSNDLASENSDMYLDDEHMDEDRRPLPSRNGRIDKARESVTRDELREAREIAARFDEVLRSPPHDKEADLLQLRGMLSLWIGDLVVQHQAPESGGLSRQRSPESDQEDERQHRPDVIGREAKQREIERAVELFALVVENGGRLWEGVEQFAPSAN